MSMTMTLCLLGRSDDSDHQMVAVPLRRIWTVGQLIAWQRVYHREVIRAVDQEWIDVTVETREEALEYVSSLANSPEEDTIP